MSTIPMVNRRALIIHNAGDELNDLPGVRQDMGNIQAFLRSDCGGAWEDYEVTVAPDDCSREWLIDYFLRVRNASYHLIFFVGHGYFERHQGPIYCLPSGEDAPRTWLRRLTKNAPTLFVTDSCKSFASLQDSSLIAETRTTFSDTADEERRRKCRMEYNRVVSSLPYGMFVHASSVSPGQEAQEDSEKGGFYIFSLMATARGIVSNTWNKAGVYGIASVHTRASRQVKLLSEGRQTPTLEGCTRSHQPPFVVKL